MDRQENQTEDNRHFSNMNEWNKRGGYELQHRNFKAGEDYVFEDYRDIKKAKSRAKELYDLGHWVMILDRANAKCILNSSDKSGVDILEAIPEQSKITDWPEGEIIQTSIKSNTLSFVFGNLIDIRHIRETAVSIRHLVSPYAGYAVIKTKERRIQVTTFETFKKAEEYYSFECATLYDASKGDNI